MGSGIVRVIIVAVLLVLLATEFSEVLREAKSAIVSSIEETKSSEDPNPAAVRRQKRNQLVSTMKHVCLPKLICELNAGPHKEQLSEPERELLALISDTTIGTTAEVTSKYHFAAHMGQLIAGVDGTGCHNFYPTCPFPGLQVLNILKKVKL
ncbi:uncharacterized protein LOC111048364 [Nilaparvata lugens]|uniref:uncharacterized protein LOC111048364 n=1 Tax=Nilaparvata lugens TaxID=108931 RepID=UPI000B98A7E8|nr:uncharacterized protein LOC111048364 [Nilaparvata lugens]